MLQFLHFIYKLVTTYSICLAKIWGVHCSDRLGYHMAKIVRCPDTVTTYGFTTLSETVLLPLHEMWFMSRHHEKLFVLAQSISGMP